MTADLLSYIAAAHKAIDENRLGDATEFIARVESELTSDIDIGYRRNIKANLAGAMIDLGTYTHDEALLARGTHYATQAIESTAEKDRSIAHYYNAANGYASLWDLQSRAELKRGGINDNYLQAKTYYRKAIDLASQSLSLEEQALCKSLFVNYANNLDSVGRNVEAVTWYDRALNLDEGMALALGNKAITLHRLAFLAHGHTHAFLVEAHRLLQAALQNQLETPAAQTFSRHLHEIEQITVAHGEHGIEAEPDTASEPRSPFHRFLQGFCLNHRLYLTPTTFLSADHHLAPGDPLFISRMVAPLNDEQKFDRYVTFLNQIKQDYVLARYFLVQSQYRADAIDTVDWDVALYYPLDYSLHSAYIELMKSSLRLAVDVLDKVAFFVWDYCGITTINKLKVNFRTLWAAQASLTTLRPELANRDNAYLIALLDLSLDVRDDGYYGDIYKRRNALTHRFLVVHDMVLDRQTNPDIPRLHLHEFLRECIQALQIARAAVIYLILLVDTEERKLGNEHRFGVIRGTPVDDAFRWTPS
ncbi:MAG: LA2681 family HEPN domain-containing protein [Chloroflexi bacterium]|nr:LA2681 family HEPN domain-containing protein [Chloroflexota bacterium]